MRAIKEQGSSIPVNRFQVIRYLPDIYDRTILMYYLVFQCRRPESHISQVMKKMLVHYYEFTTENTRPMIKAYGEYQKHNFVELFYFLEEHTSRLYDYKCLRYKVQNIHCSQESGWLKQLALVLLEENFWFHSLKSYPWEQPSPSGLKELHSTYQVEEFPESRYPNQAIRNKN